MKTIFITSFEGVETKNLLRTSILSTILRSPDVRIVLFTHTQERVIYHKKEFGEKGIVYEVVPRQRVTGLDRLFQKLKFTLLRTETTDIRRRMKYETDKRFIAYEVTMAANLLFARKFVRLLFRFFDYHLIRNDYYDAYFKKYNPAGVVSANLFDESEVDLVRAAKKRGIKTIGFINSWDRVTARSFLRILPDRTIVFNHIVKDELIRHDHASVKDIFVGGMPQYDHYVARKPLSRDEFFKKLDIPVSHKLIVYAPVGTVYGNSDWAVMDFLHRLIEEKRFGDNVDMLVRFSPNDSVDQKEIAKRPWIMYDHPGLRFTDERGGDWDMDAHDLAHLADTLNAMSLLVGYASSLAIDVAFFDKPVISLNFEVEKHLTPAQSPTSYQQMVHAKTLRRPGGMRFVQNEQELVLWVKKYLADPKLDHEGRKRLIHEQCVYTDGKSGERIGEFILKELNQRESGH